jgi:phosphoribosylanthranilate isomerase
MIVKCCGLNPTRDVQLCLDLNVDFLGFIFYEKSPRNIKISDLGILKNYNKKNSLFTAVTVDANNELIDQINSKNIQCIQLHGSETNDRIKEIKTRSKLKVIKTVQVRSETDINTYKQYFDADYILFDTPSMEGSIEFPIDLIQKLPKGENFALAGSISMETIENIAKLGVKFCDLSSKLESKLGYKDPKKIVNFMKKIKEINENTSF